MSGGEFLSFSGSFVCLCVCVCEIAWLFTHQHCLVLRDSNLASPLRWEFLNQFLCHFPSTLNGLDFFLSLSPPLQPYCNLKSAWCKYCYCWRRNQTFMRERDLGRNRESRSRMRWQDSDCCSFTLFSSLSSQPYLSIPSFLHSLILSPPVFSFSRHLSFSLVSSLSFSSPPPLLSFVFLYYFSPLIFCLPISP